METHVALNTGVITALVDQHESGPRNAVKAQEEMNENPKTKQTGAATYVNENFDRNALLAPVNERGTTYDIFF